MGLGASAAGAGEITGNGTDNVVKVNFFCAYSGLNDLIDEMDPGKTQNWGTIPKEFRDTLRSIGVSPNTECNGHLNPYKKP